MIQKHINDLSRLGGKDGISEAYKELSVRASEWYPVALNG